MSGRFRGPDVNRSVTEACVFEGRIPARQGSFHMEDRSMIGEFKAFLLKHGVIALAVAVVIGGAVQKLVAAIVADLIMPIIGALTPGGNWRTATLSIGVVKLGVGDFLGAVLDFLIIALVVFLIVKTLVREEPAAPAA